jgi:bifunctional N-acetylglucosamine-1-phosphate-uridyltransferase/glucosamine-1-phosphate-acetyltransferase GlmU-like protein
VRHRLLVLITPTVVGVAATVALACSSSTAPKLTPQTLAGAYTLDTLSTTTNSTDIVTFTPPQGRGTLLLTESTYQVYIVEETGATPADTTVVRSDSGTYALNGSALTETSLTGQPTVTATVSLRSTGLDMQVTSATQITTYAWGREQ